MHQQYNTCILLYWILEWIRSKKFIFLSDNAYTRVGIRIKFVFLTSSLSTMLNHGSSPNIFHQLEALDLNSKNIYKQKRNYKHTPAALHLHITLLGFGMKCIIVIRYWKFICLSDANVMAQW